MTVPPPQPAPPQRFPAIGAPPPPARGDGDGPDRVRFEDLAGPSAVVEIEHAGQIYRLRRTRAGKLLLTK